MSENETVDQLDVLLKDQPKTPLRPAQVDEFTEERDRLRSIVNAPAWQTGADRGAASKRFKQIDKFLVEQAPKPLDPTRKDRVAVLAESLLGQILSTFLPRSVMRRNPAGSVDAFRRGEGSKATKRKIMTWKRAMRAVDPENTDQDYTNLERFRAEGTPADGSSTFMANAQIPGKFAMTPAAKENWPLGEPTVVTPVQQAQKRELSEAQKTGLLRAQAARRASIAAKKGPVTPDEIILR